MSKSNILVTGAAGFIGFHLINRLCKEGHKVVGIDNLNDYYNPKLKLDRLKKLDDFSDLNMFTFHKIDISHYSYLEKIFAGNDFDCVINLAAQAGVRYSLENPSEYVKSNIQGFLNILECCRHNNVDNLIYASSSSVYGSNTILPFSESDKVDSPLSIYGASKKSNELMAHTYSHLFGLNTIGLRFFTVYGPWGRPDMALNIFTNAILSNKPLKIFNMGKHRRSFTYIDDVIESIYRLLKIKLNEKYSIFNIGGENSVDLLDYISIIEKKLGLKGRYEFLPIQLGDVEFTEADNLTLQNKINFSPTTDIELGLEKFIHWYKSYYSNLFL